MTEQPATKQEVTRKFMLGVILIIVSLVIGKIVLIPLIVFNDSEKWRTAAIIVYIFGWIILIPGILLAGVEGYCLVKHKYRKYRAKTVGHVKVGTQKTVDHTVRIVQKTKDLTWLNPKKNRKYTLQNQSKKSKSAIDQ